MTQILQFLDHVTGHRSRQPVERLAPQTYPTQCASPLRADRLPATLLQGQRDYFGAQTCPRTDRSGTFYTYWSQPDRPETGV